MEENDMSTKSIYKKGPKSDNMNETYSTKEDLHKAELRLENKISEVKYDLIKWMVSLWVAQGSVN